MDSDRTAALERVALAMMLVTARLPADKLGREIPVLALDPDFDDLPRDHTEGTIDDEITQEAVLRLARAAIEAYEAAQWQPIETAPRDGTPFLVAVPDVPDSVDAVFFYGGWYQLRDRVCRLIDEPTQFSVWRPLPAPPPREGARDG